MTSLKTFLKEMSVSLRERSRPQEVHGAITTLIRLGVVMGGLSAVLLAGNGVYFLKTQRELRALQAQASDVRHLRSDLHSLSASLFTMVQMRPPLTLVNRALFRGYQIQGVSMLTDMLRRNPDLLSGNLTDIRALTGLFVYSSLQNIEREGFDTPHLNRPLVPPALASQMYGLIQGLDRRIDHQERTIESRRVLIRHREMTGGIASLLLLVFFLVAFLLIESRSFSFLKTLEFEVDLTKRLLITSDVIREWKEFAKDLLFRINKSFPVKFLFTLFVTPDDTYEVYIFWNGVPEDSVRRFFEEAIETRIRQANTHLSAEKDLAFLHEMTHETAPLGEEVTRDILMETETLLLDRPQIGGIVGVGLAGKDLDPIRKTVVRGFLVSILNVLGSVKALSLYNKEIEYYAVRDPLTRLFNQRVFWELLEYEVGRAKRHRTRFVLCVIDLDDFKGVNDAYGHSTGDAFLKAMADLLINEIRLGDILARYGGDEFTLILPETDLPGALSFIGRLKEKITEFRMDPGEGHPPVEASVSIGLAAFPDHADTHQDLFTVADQMMYRAKQAGKNTVRAPMIEEALHLHATAKRDAHLLQLIREKQVMPYFQPFIDLASGEIVGHEVLARLRDTDGQIVPAGEFIALAERAGLVATLDFDILERALSLAEERDIRGRLFFNLTPNAMAIPDFVPRIVESVQKHRIPTSQLAFEITEREAIKNIRIVETMIRELKELGFLFSIDDFGAGFSSHHYLRAFPVDYLKIDAPFIQGAGRSHAVDLAIVHSIVRLATSLGVQTVGEGIETEADLEAAKSCGVTLGQGFFLGMPAPAPQAAV